MTTRARSWLLLLLPLCTLVSACTSAGDAERIVVRLVDATAEESPAPVPAASPRVSSYSLDGVAAAVRGPSRAVVNDDMRYTFPRIDRQLIHRDTTFSLPDAPQVEVTFDLPPAYDGCERLVAEVLLTEVSENAFKTRIATSNAVIGSCRRTADTSRFAAVVPTPEPLRGRTVDLWVLLAPLQDDVLRQRRFTIQRVPTGARLRFSYGVEAAAWSPTSAAAVFRVRAEGEGTPLFETRLDPGHDATQRRWFEGAVDLHAFAGRPMTLVLETEPDGEAADPTLPLWGNPMIVASSPMENIRPRNLILVSLDTLRARSVSAYGAERNTTPFFDYLARGGALFEHAVVQAPSTPESHMSIFTSLYPHEHGVAGLLRSAVNRYQTLAEILRIAGYSTGAVTEDGMLAASVGFERGFDQYRENKSADVLAPEGHVEQTFTDAVAWMAEHRHDPFFLFVHTYQVHEPYSPPPGYREMFARADAQGPEEARDRYEEEVRYVDDQLARLWSEIVRLGIADTTLLVITADHGEEFGEHGALRHGADLFDEALEVPLMMRGPLVAAGVRIAEPVMSLDLLPTVLDLLGLPPAPQAHGRSLAAAFGAESARSALLTELHTRPIYAEAWTWARVLVGEVPDPDWRAPMFARRAGRWKLLWRPHADNTDGAGAFDLYDLETDPAEHHLVNGEIDVAARRELVAYGTAAMAALGAAHSITPDPRTAAKLRALGYIQ